MDHEELLKEAEQLAKQLDREEKIDWAFKYSYIGNHELRLTIAELQNLKKLVWGIGSSLIVGLVLTMFKLFLG